MANSGPAVGVRQYPTSMRRTAPAGSRIPVPQSQRPNEGRHVSAPSQRSRLQVMQDAYQQKLMREKEEKMLAIYDKQQRQQEQALERVQRQEGGHQERQDSGQGIVRDFFRERREMEQSHGSENILSRDKHFQQKRLEKKKKSSLTVNALSQDDQTRKPSLRADREEQRRHEERKENEMQLYKKQWQETQSQSSPKHGQGVMRSKPLAPIKQAIVKRKDKPYSSLNHYETQGNLEEDEETDEYAMPLVKSQKVSNRSKPTADTFDGSLTQSPSSQRKVQPSKTINTKKVAPPIARGKPTENRAKKEKESDFQKWQAEQDQQRKERLKKYEEQQSKQKGYSVDYDKELEDNVTSAKSKRKMEYDEMLARERELEALIAKRKADLAKIATEDDDDDDEDVTYLPHKSETKNKNKSKQKQSLRSKQQFEGDTSAYHDPNDGDNESRAGEFKNSVRSKQKQTMKPSLDIDDDMPPPSYHNQTQEDSESRVGEFKSRNKQAASKPKKKHSFATEEPEAVPPYKPPSPVMYDTSFYEQAGDGEGVDVNLVPCSICGRNFAAERLAKHKSICKNAGKKKRKVFDSTKQRISDTEMAQFMRKGQHLKNDPEPKPNNWRHKHEEFQRAIRDARQTQAYVAKGGNLADLPPPPPSENPDYKQCPYCERRFNPTAAERHIPKCKDNRSRPKPPPRKK